jgi:hypothetical protein
MNHHVIVKNNAFTYICELCIIPVLSFFFFISSSMYDFAIDNTPHTVLKVFQYFGKHYSCHFVSIIWPLKLLPSSPVLNTELQKHFSSPMTTMSQKTETTSSHHFSSTMWSSPIGQHQQAFISPSPPQCLLECWITFNIIHIIFLKAKATH